MKREEQTEQVKERLYFLTLSFVRKYQPIYYKQYRGHLEDLASEFYCQFLTPKSRIKGQEESLLDKFDTTITTLEYVTKVSVQRMLIDRSRRDKHPVVSIDKFVDEYGDLITKTFSLSTTEEDTVDSIEFTQDFKEDVRLAFSKLTKKAKENFIKTYLEVRNVIAKEYSTLFDSCFEMPVDITFEVQIDNAVADYVCTQITTKTVCLEIEGKIYNFDRFTGAGRGKLYRDWKLTLPSLLRVKDYETYKAPIKNYETVPGLTI